MMFYVIYFSVHLFLLDILRFLLDTLKARCRTREAPGEPRLRIYTVIFSIFTIYFIIYYLLFTFLLNYEK